MKKNSTTKTIDRHHGLVAGDEIILDFDGYTFNPRPKKKPVNINIGEPTWRVKEVVGSTMTIERL